MTTVTFGELTYDVALPGQGDGLPILDDRSAPRASQDVLAQLGNGAVPRRGTVLPYDTQRGYDGVADATTLRTAVISDGRATATFLLDLGGRLWSLVVDGREVLFQPDPLQVGNLALRNAWFAGGTEWNLGFTGHWPLTCAPVFAGVVEGARPVLRLWEYERMLGLVWRIDATIVDGTLFVHPVLANPSDRDVPVYWWSNTAVPLTDDTLVVVAADDAWHFGPARGLDLVSVPSDPACDGGADVTYPARVPGASDHFFRVSDAERPWICAVGGDGRGFGHASTSRLPGRKLFRWGSSPGGRRWQEWLSPRGGAYLEVQAGLASTQLEHLPLPAGSTWEWTEAYGLVEGVDVGGAWQSAVAAARAGIDRTAAGLDAADRLLRGVRDTPPVTTAFASGWGALEVAAGHLRDDPAVPFGETGPEQEPWLHLARHGVLPQGRVPLPVTGPAWRTRLAAVVDPDPATAYHAGLAALADDDSPGALPLLRTAADGGLWEAHRALGHLSDDPAACADHLLAAASSGADSPALRLELLTALGRAGRHAEVMAHLSELADAERATGRARLALVRASLVLGDLDTARRVLVEEGLRLPDLREGEDSMESLWRDYQELAGTAEPLPAAYDFRMHP